MLLWHGGAYIVSDKNALVNIIQGFASLSKLDAVYNVYMCPTNIINNTSESAQYSGQNAPVTLTTTFSKTNTIDGYTPRNNKLLTFPYQYLLVSNNNGSSNILHFERFNGQTCNFNIKGVPVVRLKYKINTFKLR